MIELRRVRSFLMTAVRHCAVPLPLLEASETGPALAHVEFGMR
jgi:hypothetical protein